MEKTKGSRSIGLSRTLTILLAVVCGFAVANLYYAQPLLPAISDTFHIHTTQASQIVTIGQTAYVLGILFLVPLGDLRERRSLTVGLLFLTALGLGGVAVAPSFMWLMVATMLFSLTTVTALILLPFAATLATPESRGRVIGIIMSGVLSGVLFARTVSGILAQAGSWRLVYAAACFAMFFFAVLIWISLPKSSASSKVKYTTLFSSMIALIRQEPLLRLRAFYGLVSFAGFSALWTSLAFLLHSYYKYNEAIIGMFGLAGIAGTLIALRAGKLIDAHKESLATGTFFGAILLGWLFMAINHGTELFLLLGGIVLLDLGVQGVHVLNQGVIYRLRPEARSRLTTIYMSAYFLGGASGSALSTLFYAYWQWSGVCILGIVLGLIALLLWAWDVLTPYQPTSSL